MPRSPSGASARPSPRVSIKSLELNALHTSRIQDMVHLNGNRSNGFSAHADQSELLTWQKQTSAKRTFLVHGEEDTMKQFAAHLVDTRVEMPEPDQVFEL